MRTVAIYLRERFPLPATLMLSAIFAATSVGLFSGTVAFSARWWTELGLLAVLYEALLLRYRVTDEWKDFAHDNETYPNRPVQRGAISVRTLLAMGVIAFVVELTSVVLLGSGVGLLLYVPILVYSALTAAEFFAKSWFSAHFTAAVVVHQFVYVLLFAWVVYVLGAPFSLASWMGIAAASLLFCVVEILRKLEPRVAPDGSVVPDSYGAMWGRKVAVWLIVGSIVATGALAWMAGASLAVPAVSIVSAILISFAQTKGKVVVYLGAAYALAFSILVLL